MPEFNQVFHRIVDPSGIYEHWKMRRILRGNPPDDAAIRMRLQDHHNAHWLYHHLAPVDAASDEQRYGPPKDTNTCYDPWIFSLENGMVGIAPWRARESDVVVLLQGGPTPFLLRTTDERGDDTTFELVGECFVSGAMHGKVMQEFLDSGTEPEVFTLV